MVDENEGKIGRTADEEIREDNVQEELDQLLTASKEFRDLIETPGWRRLVRIMEAQQTVRANSILMEDISDMNGIIANLANKGERKGIGLVLAFPQVAIEGMEGDIKILQAQVVANHEAGISFDDSNDSSDFDPNEY
jgi:hypothetical protein